MNRWFRNVAIMAVACGLLWSCVSTALGETPFQQLARYDSASVKLMNGCSGTLVCPRTVVTAAHCRTTGDRVEVKFNTGWEAKGRVVDHDEKTDVAVVRLDRPIEESKATPVPVSRAFPKDGDKVLAYGVASAAGGNVIKRWRAEVDGGNDGGWLDLRSDTSAIGGESGGGVFRAGHLVGVISRTDDYYSDGEWTGCSPTTAIYKMVREHCACDW